jgi:hypothetical protein
MGLTVLSSAAHLLPFFGNVGAGFGLTATASGLLGMGYDGYKATRRGDYWALAEMGVSLAAGVAGGHIADQMYRPRAVVARPSTRVSVPLEGYDHTLGLGLIPETNSFHNGTEHTPGFIDRIGCFAAGTLIHVCEEPNLEEELDDILYGEDEDAAFWPVIHGLVDDGALGYRVTFTDEDNRVETITVIGKHPFWVTGEGWKGAEELRPADLIESPDRPIAIVDSVEVIDLGEPPTLIAPADMDGIRAALRGESEADSLDADADEAWPDMPTARARVALKDSWMAPGILCAAPLPGTHAVRSGVSWALGGYFIDPALIEALDVLQGRTKRSAAQEPPASRLS